jgi:PAS domain S-box-containing protein
MKISHKLFLGYLVIALIMGMAGYLSVSIFIDIKKKVVELKADTLDMLGASEELIRAIETSQKSTQALIDNKLKIVYTYPVTTLRKHQEAESQEQIKLRLKANLAKIEQLLSPLIKMTHMGKGSAEELRLQSAEKNLKDWLVLRKKHFYYYWKYLAHLVKLADETPDQACSFFEKTLEPHYRENISPVINRYWKSEKSERDKQISKIINEYIPDAWLVIIISTTVTLLSVFGLGFWVSRSVSAPLRRLTEAAQEIGRGQLGIHIDIRRHDEVGILAGAFNRMAIDLSRTTVSKTYVDNIIESMLDTLIVVNPDNTIRTANRAALDLLGYDESALIGKPVSEVLIEEKPERSTINSLMSTGSIGNLEKTYLTRNGGRIPVQLSGAVMRRDNSSIEGIVCVARDIRERKRSELALKKAYDEMERRVDERTTELLEANLLLKKEISGHQQTEAALRQSERRLRRLSSHIITAQEKERKRISMELHDDLGQSLSLLKVQLSSIQNRLNGNGTAVADDLQETRQYLDSVIENVRRLSRDLSPSLLADLGLTAAIDWLINDFKRYYTFEISRDIETIDTLFSSEKQIILYRIFQEIMSNIAKHARASHVRILMKTRRKLLTVQVADDGKGFNLDQVTSMHAAEKGMGLAAMQERVLMLGSVLNIETGDGKGTRIHFKIPFDKKVQE